MATSHRLRLMDRYGYGHSADRADKVRLQADAEAIVELIAGGSHVVGHSYGGLICLLAAARASGFLESHAR